jgi:hypothetical protein
LEKKKGRMKEKEKKKRPKNIYMQGIGMGKEDRRVE